MGITTESQAGTGALLGLRRQSFKQANPKKRKGLSAFYSSKSQSFNCITDLQRNPFCQSSSVMLAKPNSLLQTPHFSSIPEDICDLDLQQQQQPAQHLSASAPGSPMHAGPGLLLQQHHDLWYGHHHGTPFEAVEVGWLDGSERSKTPELQHEVQQQQQQQQHGFNDGLPMLSDLSSASSTCSTGDASLQSPCRSPSPCDSLQVPTLSIDACDTFYPELPGAACRCMYQLPTEGLCHALKAATLQHPTQLVGVTALGCSC